MEPVPFSVFEAAVRVAGQGLHWKHSLRRILRTSGVSENGYERYSTLSKYVIMRSIWDDLDRAGARGRRVQHQIIQALSNIDRPEDQAPDQAAGRAAIAELRRLATEAKLLVDPAELERTRRREATAAAIAEKSARRERLEALSAQFRELWREEDPQRRGYAFEAVLSSLFRLSELDYHGSYKTETDQIDGAVTLDSFTYLLEARWRKAPAVDQDLGGFTHKVERRIDATRGLFISMAGYRDEVVELYRRAKENRLILMDGQDLALILEGRIDLLDGLREKVRAAAIQGEPYLQLATLTDV